MDYQHIWSEQGGSSHVLFAMATMCLSSLTFVDLAADVGDSHEAKAGLESGLLLEPPTPAGKQDQSTPQAPAEEGRMGTFSIGQLGRTSNER